MGRNEILGFCISGRSYTHRPDNGGGCGENIVLPMTEEAKKRKAQPVATGVLAYFPDAIKEVAKVSQAGNDQHHKGTPLHWDRAKSKDEPDALVRHLIDHLSGNPVDTDGMLHLAKVAWRSLAYLQKYLEEEKADEQEFDATVGLPRRKI